MSLSPNHNENEPDFCQGDAKTLARRDALEDYYDNLSELVSYLSMAKIYARLAGVYLTGDLDSMIISVKEMVKEANREMMEGE